MAQQSMQLQFMVSRCCMASCKKSGMGQRRNLIERPNIWALLQTLDQRSKMVCLDLFIYLSRYLDQETVKEAFRPSESSCHLLLTV